MWRHCERGAAERGNLVVVLFLKWSTSSRKLGLWAQANRYELEKLSKIIDVVRRKLCF